MKRSKYIILLILTFGVLNSYGQKLSKTEAKKWKTVLKRFKKNPAELKQIMETSSKSRQKISELEGANNALQADLTSIKSQVLDLEEEASQATIQYDSLQTVFNSFQSSQSEVTESSNRPTSNDYMNGVVFRVQIGAFKEKNLSKYFDNNPNLGGEIGADPSDPQRITIGIFRDYWEADTFKKYMREMGVSDAWIVPFRDGVRVPISSVLDNIPPQN